MSDTKISKAQAKKYLVDKKMDVEDREEILASLEWNDDCVSPHAFARKHALFKRPCLRSAARSALLCRSQNTIEITIVVKYKPAALNSLLDGSCVPLGNWRT